VKRRGSDKKFVAAVLAVGTECDIGELQKSHTVLFGVRIHLSSGCSAPEDPGYLVFNK
jgi:hypothetical protein